MPVDPRMPGAKQLEPFPILGVTELNTITTYGPRFNHLLILVFSCIPSHLLSIWSCPYSIDSLCLQEIATTINGQPITHINHSAMVYSTMTEKSSLIALKFNSTDSICIIRRIIRNNKIILTFYWKGKKVFELWKKIWFV